MVKPDENRTRRVCINGILCVILAFLIIINYNKMEPDVERVLNLIEKSDLMLITAFRMAAKEIRQRDYKSAGWRIISELDKIIDRESINIFRAFYEKFSK